MKQKKPKLRSNLAFRFFEATPPSGSRAIASNPAVNVLMCQSANMLIPTTDKPFVELSETSIRVRAESESENERMC